MPRPPDLTARTLVLGSAANDVRPQVSDLARRHDLGGRIAGVLGRLTHGGQGLVCEEVGHVADGLLDLDLTEIVVRGWERHRALAEAREWTSTHPGAEAVIPLATHTVSSSYEPVVDVLVGETPVARIELSLRIETTGHGLVVTVSSGRVDSVRAGRLDILAKLSCEGAQLAERGTSLDLPSIWAPTRMRTGDYRPGDVVNGHRLNATATAWEPVRPL